MLNYELYGRSSNSFKLYYPIIMPGPEFEIPNTAFAQAFLEAKAREGEKSDRGKPRRIKRNGKTVSPPGLISSAIGFARQDFERERANIEAEEIADEAIEQFGGSRVVFDIRKPTVHIQPHAVLEEQRQGEETLKKKLVSKAKQVGMDWGRWIDKGRKGGWQSIRKELSGNWFNLVVAALDLEAERRVEVLEAFVHGTGIREDRVFPESKMLDQGTKNKVDCLRSYMFRMGQIKKNHPPITLAYSGLVVIWIEQLSNLSEEQAILSSYHQNIRNGIVDPVRDLKIKQVCSKFAHWLDQPAVRDFFKTKHPPGGTDSHLFFQSNRSE